MNLGVNIDHVATLRNARGGVRPSVLDAGLICERTGASAITIHLREDRRHIKDADVAELKKNLSAHINLEMAVTDEMQQIALKTLPHSVCLVPEKRQELTTEGGLDVVLQKEKIKNFITPLKEQGIIVSLFINPNEDQIQAASDVGADFIELHTGSFAKEYGGENEEFELEKLKNAAKLAQSLGLKVNAGHGLDYDNVIEMHKIDGLVELNIGHSIISRAIFVGLERAVVEMMSLVQKEK